jgi:uncharacterized delta-60 repeat protein
MRPFHTFRVIVTLIKGIMLRKLLLAAGLTTLLTNSLAEPLTFVDPSFAPSITGKSAYAARAWLQPDQKILVAGDDLRSVNGVVTPKLVRLNPDGSIDPTFHAPGDVGSIMALDFTSDKIVFASAWRIRRLFSNGAADDAFFAEAQDRFSGDQVIYNLLAQPDATVLVAASMMNGTNGGPIFKLTQGGVIDQTFQGQTNYGVVRARQPDGNLLVASSILDTNNGTRAKLIRLHADGLLDPTFASPIFTNEARLADINAVALQPDGKLLIAGDFSSADNKSRNGVARLNGDGSLDDTFDPGAGASYGRDPNNSNLDPFTVISVSVASDRKIYISGRFKTYDGEARARIARLFPDGKPDPAFIPPELPQKIFYYAEPLSTQLQKDGKLLVSQNYPSSADIGSILVRLNSDASIDTTFQPNLAATAPVTALCVAGARIYAAGNFEQINGSPRALFAALTSDAKLDATFPNVPLDRAPSVIIETSDNGKILLGGSFTNVHGVVRRGLARLNNDGSLDTAFDSNLAPTSVTAIALESTGTILVGGQLGTANVARLDSNGAVIRKFGIFAASAVTALAAADDGKFLVAGDTLTISNQTRKGLARLNQDGSLDASFTPDFGLDNHFISPGKVESIALLPDGKILAAGALTNAAYPGQFIGVVRLNGDGALDASFLPVLFSVDIARYTNPNIHFAVLPNGQILMSGSFTKINGRTRVGIARINPDGALDNDFDASIVAAFYDMRVDRNGAVIVAGILDRADGLPRTGLLRILPQPVPHPEGRGLKVLGHFDAPGYQLVIKGMSQHRVSIEMSTNLKDWASILQTYFRPRDEEFAYIGFGPSGPPRYFRAVEVP